MPQETKAHDNTTPGDKSVERDSLQGMVATKDDERALLDALEEAFDYRGDITLTLTDGSSVMGYLFDRRRKETLADSVVRLMTPESDEYVVVPFDRIATLEFTGKDTAHGKTFERWVERFIEKKMAGEKASIEGEGGA